MTDNQPLFEAKASRSGYIVFGFLYLPICALTLVALAMGKLRGQEYVILIPWGLLIPMYVWLLGFKIRITPEMFEYRDGLWKCYSCRRDQILNVKSGWVEFSRLGRRLSFPRIVIDYENGKKERIIINPKPFSRQDLKRLHEILKTEP